MQKIDCCKLPCPKPVLATKDLIEAHPEETVQIRVNNDAARENVSRFLHSQGWKVEVEEGAEGVFVVTGSPGACAIELPAATKKGTESQKILVFIPTDVIGQGDDELGGALMKNFIATLKEMGDDLWRVVLVNNGVKLAIEGSGHLSELQGLAKQGVDILVCGTCLNFFGLLEKKAVGDTTNMLDIVTSMKLATKVIRV
jgi:selenium metabolism protein YedF